MCVCVCVCVCEWESVLGVWMDVCFCNLRYPARNAHAPYCHLCPAPLYHIFPHYLTNGTILGEKVAEHKMCVLIFCTAFVWTFLILSRTERDMIGNVYIYTGCPRRNVPDSGRVFLMLNYTDITQNAYVQSWSVTEIMAREVWNFDSCYTLIDCQIHIETGRNMWFL